MSNNRRTRRSNVYRRNQPKIQGVVTEDDGSLTIDAAPVKTVTVNLVGATYECTPPKGASTMNMALAAEEDGASSLRAELEVLEGWLEQAFGEEVAEEILERLEDPEDALDTPHIQKLMQALLSAATGDPTT